MTQVCAKLRGRFSRRAKVSMRPDEMVYTPTQRFDALGVASTEQSRRGLGQELVPIVVPKAWVYGSHSNGRCDEVTSVLLHSVLNALIEQGVTLEVVLRALYRRARCDRANALENYTDKLEEIPFAGAGASHDLELGDD